MIPQRVTTRVAEALRVMPALTPVTLKLKVPVLEPAATERVDVPDVTCAELNEPLSPLRAGGVKLSETAPLKPLRGVTVTLY